MLAGGIVQPFPIKSGRVGGDGLRRTSRASPVSVRELVENLGTCTQVPRCKRAGRGWLRWSLRVAGKLWRSFRPQRSQGSFYPRQRPLRRALPWAGIFRPVGPRDWLGGARRWSRKGLVHLCWLGRRSWCQNMIFREGNFQLTKRYNFLTNWEPVCWAFKIKVIHSIHMDSGCPTPSGMV